MTAPWVYISDLSRHEGEEIRLKCWMYNKRSSGKIHFLQLRDGTGFIQGVVVKGEIPEDQFLSARNLWLEASLEITVWCAGTIVRLRDLRSA